MADVVGTTLSIVELTRLVIGYVDAVKGGDRDREMIKFKIEAAGKIIATLNQVAKDAPPNSPSSDELQSIISPGANGAPSLLSRYKSLLCGITGKLEPKGHDNHTLQRLRKITFKATWPFDKGEVGAMVRDLESLQGSFQSVLQAVLGGMMSSVRDSVNDSVTVLEGKLDQVLGWQKDLHDSAEEEALGDKLDHLQDWLTEFLDWKRKDVLGSKLDHLQGCLAEFLDWKHEDVLGRKLDRIQSGQDKLQRLQEEEALRTFCSKLSNLSPDSEVESMLRASQGSEPYWIFEEPVFEDWITDSSSRVLWAKGNAGAGKSVLAAVVAGRLREAARSSSSDASSAVERIMSTKTSATAAFFFKYQEKGVTADIVQRSIARQLLEQGGAEFWLDKGVKYTTSHDGGRLDVAELLRFLLSHFHQVFLIIDALDECDDDKQGDIVDLLKSLLVISPSVYLLVTSRADMEKYFSEKGSLHQAKRVNVAARGEDVQAYVLGKMEKVANRSDAALSEVKKKDREEIARKVVKVTDGVFLVAVRHMLTLGDCENQYSLEKAVSSLSSDLGKTYDEAIRRIFAQSESKKELGRRALLWVVNMRRPLRMTQLRQALATYDSEDDLDERHVVSNGGILAATKGLITADRESTVLSIHKSLADYFNSKEKKKEVFLCDPDEEMTRICLKYMTFSRFSCAVVGIWDIMDEAHQLELHKRIYHNPFSLYAAQCWGWHAGGENEDHLMNEILAFFTRGGHLRSAIEIWGCVGPRVNRYRHSRSSDDFAPCDLASYFHLENTYVALLFKRGEVIDYSPIFMKTNFTWDELLADPPIADTGGIG